MTVRSGWSVAIVSALFVAALVAGCTKAAPGSASRERVTSSSSASSTAQKSTATSGSPPASASASSANTSQEPQQSGSASADGQALKTRSARVVRVVDGDTAVLAIGGKEEKVRFIGVDTPESTIQHEAYGKQAAAFTRHQLTGRTVFVETDVEGRDRYGRLLGYIWLSQPSKVSDSEIRKKQFNARLMLDGYAQLMTIPPNVKYVDYYRDYQREAREKDRGLWGLSAAEDLPTAGAAFIASNKAEKFHKPNCFWAQRISERNMVKFKSRGAAIEAGFKPCEICKP